MPKSFTQADRERVTIHADWWSSEQDAHGQWLERVVLFSPQTERDSQWITDMVQQQETKDAKRAGKSTRDMAMDRLAPGSKNMRMFTIMRMVADITDEHGKSILPPPSLPLEQRMDFWRGVPDKDMAYIAEQIDNDNSEPAVPVLPEDVDEAQANADHNATLGATAPVALLRETSPVALAEDHFRPTGQGGAPE